MYCCIPGVACCIALHLKERCNAIQHTTKRCCNAMLHYATHATKPVMTPSVGSGHMLCCIRCCIIQHLQYNNTPLQVLQRCATLHDTTHTTQCNTTPGAAGDCCTCQIELTERLEYTKTREARPSTLCVPCCTFRVSSI